MKRWDRGKLESSLVGSSYHLIIFTLCWRFVKALVGFVDQCKSWALNFFYKKAKEGLSCWFKNERKNELEKFV